MTNSVPSTHHGIEVQGRVAEALCIYEVFETLNSKSDWRRDGLLGGTTSLVDRDTVGLLEPKPYTVQQHLQLPALERRQFPNLNQKEDAASKG
jgi:hypothetical protein